MTVEEHHCCALFEERAITLEATIPAGEAREFMDALREAALENAKRLAAQLAAGIRLHGVRYALAWKLEWITSEHHEDFGYGWEIVDAAIAELVCEGLQALTSHRFKAGVG